MARQRLTVARGNETDETIVPQHLRDFNQSVGRGLAVIETFGADARYQTVTEVASKTGLTRASARRFLLTLVELGYVGTDGRTFWLAPRVLGLGYSFLSSLRVPGVALPHLERLAAEVDESSGASILDGRDIVYVARALGRKLMTIAISVGSRMPADTTSMGRVLLAGLRDDELERYLATAKLERRMPQSVTDRAELRARTLAARADGYAIVSEELEEGLIAIAVPIHDRVHRVVAAIGLSTHVGRYTPESARTELLPPVQRTAARIERDLGSVVRSRSPR